jgi:hypothetical protein
LRMRTKWWQITPIYSKRRYRKHYVVIRPLSINIQQKELSLIMEMLPEEAQEQI